MQKSIYKKIAKLCLCLLLSATITKAQNQNALAFDGIDDQVTVTGGSSVIVNATGISLTCWVYATNTAPTYPDFDGFAGIRDDASADFYLVQTGATQLEARFRNSSGIEFTMNYFGLTLNTWQHYAFTYDGSKIRLYKNGVAVDSLAANGAISATTVPFLIGNVHYTNADYLLTGKMDEVSFWSRSITQQEIHCIYLSAVDTSSAGLQLYYKFDQAIAGGNNAGADILTDITGHIDGNLENFALTGTTSNWVAGVTTYIPAAAAFCRGSSYNFNGQTLTTAGVYTGTFTSASGCDSLVKLTLSVDSVDTAVTQNGATLLAHQIGASYQWVNCNNNFSPIPGATSRPFVATTNGSYAVIITNGSCKDTSGCFTVSVLGVAENNFAGVMSLSPNPAHTVCTVVATLFNNAILYLYDITGRALLQQSFNSKLEIDFIKLTNGIYIIEVKDKEGRSLKEKLVKE